MPLRYGPREPTEHGPPAWFIATAGRPHRHRDSLGLPPFLKDVFGVWKEVAGIPSNNEGKAKSKCVWEEMVDCGGFSPEEINVNVSDGKVMVKCKHETNDGAGNVDVRELRRTINVPEDVDSEKVIVTLSTKGLIVIKAPRKLDDKETRKETPVTTEASVVRNGRIDGDECSREDWLENDQGETTGSSVDGMGTHNETTADFTKDETELENLETEAPVQRKKEALEKEVYKTEETPDPLTSKPVDNGLDTTNVDPKLITDASAAQQLEAEALSTDLPERKSVPEKENPKQPEEITLETQQAHETKISEESNNRLFEIDVDMKSFNPESIEVKLNGNTLTISGQQEVKDGTTGKVVSTRAVYRRFYIPDDVNCDLLTSSLDSQGQMTVSAPYKAVEDLTEKVIPISVQ